MHTVLNSLELLGIIPVVVLDDAGDATSVARALVDGGLPSIEVTFRTAAAAKAIESIANSYPDVVVGAGTVLTIDQADAAVSAGATFVVAPGLNRKLVEYCLGKNIPVLPGVVTPSDVETAIELGLGAVKFFPAEASGGIEYLKALAAPFRGIRFVPTGGVNASNLLAYLKFPQVLACGGSWMVSGDLIKAKKFDEIRRLTEEAVMVMLGFGLRHVGINGVAEAEARKNAELMASLLQLPLKVGTSSIFVGNAFEFTMRKFPGDHGHLAIATNFVHRAKAYLERRGYGFRSETAAEKEGKLVSVYLLQEVGGFAIHLLQA